VFGTAPSDFALEVARLIRPGDYVLDLGCGEGRDSVYFAERGGVVTGIDLSAEGIAKAKRLARSRGVRVTWWQGPMAELLKAGGAFRRYYDVHLQALQLEQRKTVPEC
jgi:2-polyprenyl-3-methyl-5-hydroxy-6-metoxy-1,4-benzoquinol methylase